MFDPDDPNEISQPISNPTKNRRLTLKRYQVVVFLDPLNKKPLVEGHVVSIDRKRKAMEIFLVKPLKKTSKITIEVHGGDSIETFSAQVESCYEYDTRTRVINKRGFPKYRLRLRIFKQLETA